MLSKTIQRGNGQFNVEHLTPLKQLQELMAFSKAGHSLVCYTENEYAMCCTMIAWKKWIN